MSIFFSFFWKRRAARRSVRSLTHPSCCQWTNGQLQEQDMDRKREDWRPQPSSNTRHSCIIDPIHQELQLTDSVSVRRLLLSLEIMHKLHPSTVMCKLIVARAPRGSRYAQHFAINLHIRVVSLAPHLLGTAISPSLAP